MVANGIKGCTKSQKLLLDASGGLKSLIAEEERQMTEADRQFIDRVRMEAERWGKDDQGIGDEGDDIQVLRQ
jgi:hypothetical protein